MKVDDKLIEATATVVARRVYGQLEADDQDRETARRILLEVAPPIARAERKRIAVLVAPHKLDALAKWLDLYHPGASDEVQRDLRLLATVLRGHNPVPAPGTEALIEAEMAIDLAAEEGAFTAAVATGAVEAR